MGELLSSDGLETSGRGTGWVGPAAPPSDPVATMEAPLYAGAQPNAAGSDRTEGLDECDEWSWSVVEQRRVSYKRGAAQAGVQWPVSGKLAGYDGSASVPAVNRRGTGPYARWCERTGEATTPPTRSSARRNQNFSIANNSTCCPSGRPDVSAETAVGRVVALWSRHSTPISKPGI